MRRYLIEIFKNLTDIYY